MIRFVNTLLSILLSSTFLLGQPEVNSNIEKASDVPYMSSNLGHTFQFGTLQKGPGVTVSYTAIFQKSALVGYGLGVDYSSYSFQDPYSFFSVYGAYKAYFGQSKFGVFGLAKVGYGSAVSGLEDDDFQNSGGIFGEAGLGIRLSNKAPMMDVMITGRWQKGDFELQSTSRVVIEDIWFKRIGIQLGFSF